MTTIHRDGSGRPTSIEAPTHLITSLTLDPEGNLWKVTNPASETTTLTYHPGQGLLATLLDPSNRLHEFEYNADGRLTRDSDPVGFKRLDREMTSSGYRVTLTTAMGRTRVHEISTLPTGGRRRTHTGSDGLATVVDESPSGVQTVSSPDGMRVTSTLRGDPRFAMQVPIVANQTIVTPLGRTQAITRTRSVSLSAPNDLLSVVSSTDTTTFNGHVYTTVFDKATSIATLTSAAGRQGTITFNAQGRPAHLALPGMLPIDIQYEGDGQRHVLTQGSRVWTLGHDSHGWLSSMINPRNHVTGFVPDAVGRMVQQTRPDGELVGLSYEPDGNLLTLTPPERPEHAFDYDAAGLLHGYTAPDAGSERVMTWEYDLDHLLVGSSRPDELPIGYVRDPASGRLVQITLPSGMGTIAIGYDPVTGNRSSVAGPSGLTLSAAYDGALPTGSTWSGAGFGAGSRAVQWTYDNDFRIATEIVDGSVVSFGYDPDGLVTQAGALTLDNHPQNGLYRGSSVGIVSDTVTPSPYGEVETYAAVAGGTALYTVVYTNDLLGRIDHMTETIQGETHVVRYIYDLAGRLSDVLKDEVLVAHHEYDENGNRLRHTTTSGEVTGTYDDQDRLLTYGSRTYSSSSAGDRTSVTDTATGATSNYTYDAMGNLRHVVLSDTTTTTTIDYLVDGAGQRIWKTNNGVNVQGFLYRSPLQPAAELNGAGNVIARFVYGRNRNVPELMIKGGTTYRILTDRRGSPRLVVATATGVVAQRMEYDELGRVSRDTSPGFQPFGFAGGIYDGDTGLVRFGARDYDPETGRWMAKDPSGFGGGGTNLYAYAFGDPVNYVDIDGHVPVPLITAGVGAAMAAVGSIVGQIIFNEDHHVDLTDVGIAAVGGAATGALAPFIVADLGLTALAGGVANVAQALASDRLHGRCPGSWQQYAFNFGTGFVGAGLGGALVPSGKLPFSTSSPWLDQTTASALNSSALRDANKVGMSSFLRSVGAGVLGATPAPPRSHD